MPRQVYRPFHSNHALFFIFSSPTKGQSLCVLHDFYFSHLSSQLK
jgi:hypothetical protein